MTFCRTAQTLHPNQRPCGGAGAPGQARPEALAVRRAPLYARGVNPYSLAPPVHQAYNHAEPWLRQPCDTDESYRVFLEYLQQGLDRRGRSLTRLVRHTDTPLGMVMGWATAHAWEARALHWDNHISVLKLDASETTAAEMAKRHARAGRRLQGIASIETGKLELQAIRHAEMPVLRPTEVLRFAEIGQMLERVALSNAPPEGESSGDLSALDLEDIRAMRRVWDKLQAAKKKPGAPGEVAGVAVDPGGRALPG